MRTLEPYSDYKESGVPWLGKVPEHWDVRWLGQIGAFSKGRGGTKEDEQYSGTPCIRYGDLYTTHSFFIQKSRSFVSRERAKEYQLVKFGDVLFAASGETIEEIGKSAVNLICSETRCGGDVILFRPHREIEARYLGYATDCRPAAIQKAIMGRGFTVVHIYASQLKRLSLALPPLSEQAAIVRFLDLADRRIRRYIRAKEKLIVLLEKQKGAIIQQAVTGQIDVRTDQPYPAYKHSGVEQLGDVPEHWGVRRLKTLCSQSALYGANVAATSYATMGVRFLRTTDITEDGTLKDGGVLISETLARDYLLKDGDLLISRSGTIGRSFLYNRQMHGPCAYAGYLVRFVPTSEIVPKYIFFFTKTQSFSGFLRVMAISSTIENVNGEKYANCTLPLPPLSEQAAIVLFLDETTANIDQSIIRTRRQIDLLHEYRTRLIADVVTGKLDVREAAAQLPEEDDEEQLEEDSTFANDLDGNDHADGDAAEDPEMTDEVPA